MAHASTVVVAPSATVRLAHSRPDFLIIGTQKGGTTSLHEHLCAHPQVLGAREKEVHYFDNQFDRGADWYLRRFPSRPRQLLRQIRTLAPTITGEATPMYLFHPLAPERIARLVPDAKLIVMVRDPVLRAYSHYQHNMREGWESLSFEKAVETEGDRTLPALESLIRDPFSLDTRLHAYSYCARGRYLEQLKRYEALFPRQQMLVLCSEEYFADPQPVYQQVLRFLGLPAFVSRATSANRGQYDSTLPSGMVSRLRQHFQPHNEALFEHLGRRLPWA